MERARAHVGLANCNSRTANSRACVERLVSSLQAQERLPRFVVLGRKSVAAPRAVVLDSNIQSGTDRPLCGFTGDAALSYATTDSSVNSAVLVVGRETVDVFLDQNITAANLAEACKNCDLRLEE